MLANGGEEQLLMTPGASNDLPYDWSTDGKWILGVLTARVRGG